MKLLKSLPARLLLGILLGIVLGLILPAGAMTVVVTLKYILGQLITFCVPLIIIGFIAPSITKLGNRGVRTVFWTVLESKFGKRHIWIRNLFRVFFEMLILLIQIHVMNEI